MLGGILVSDHFADAGLTLHRTGDRELGGVVVVLENLPIVSRFPVNEDATNDAQRFGLILGNDPFGNRVSNGLGNSVLGWTKHLNGLLGTLDRDFGDHHGRWLNGQVRGQNGQQVAVTMALIGEGIGKCDADRTRLVSDQQVDVSNLIAFTGQSFTNEK